MEIFVCPPIPPIASARLRRANQDAANEFDIRKIFVIFVDRM